MFESLRAGFGIFRRRAFAAMDSDYEFGLGLEDIDLLEADLPGNRRGTAHRSCRLVVRNFSTGSFATLDARAI